MTDNNQLQHIDTALRAAIPDLTALTIEDVTHKHSKHKHHTPGKLHLILHINAASLAKLPKLQAHRAIYKALDMQTQQAIHSLSIKLSND